MTVLYCSWFCPYAQRAWVALEEKGVEYQYVEINPYEAGQQPGAYTKIALSIEEFLFTAGQSTPRDFLG